MGKAAKERCRKCGTTILLMDTFKGKRMPVDPEPVTFAPDVRQAARFVTEEGDIVRGVMVEEDDPDRHDGYICHYDTCKSEKRGR